MSGASNDRRDFFISYNRADQTWDFRPGHNFVLEMNRAATLAGRTVLVLSPNFLESRFTQPEWAVAFADDPTGEQGRVVPVRVAECDPKGLLGPVVYIDLVGLDEEDAKNRLLTQLRSGRDKPQFKPLFPGAKTLLKPAFPAAGSSPQPNSAEHEQVQSRSAAIPLGTPDLGSPNGNPALDTAVIRKAEQELAKYMGPIATTLVRKAAKEVATPQGLYSLLAAKIKNVDEQTHFLRQVTEPRDARDRTVIISAQPAGAFDPSLLATACEELVNEIPWSDRKTKVDKAARVATTPEDFYRRLADHLHSEGERTAFLTSMMLK